MELEFYMKDGGFFTDLPYGKLDISGDEKYGFRPYQLLVSSIAVCSGGVLRNIMERMRLQVDDIQLKANLERNEEQSGRIEKISLHFKIIGTDLKKDRVERAMKLTRKNCAMVQSVIDSIEVTETYEIVEKS